MPWRAALACLGAGLIFTPTSVEKDASGTVTKIVGTVVHRDAYTGKRVSYIQWVSSKSPDEQPKRAEIRVYKQLFQSELPPGPHKNLVDDVNPDSLTILSAFVDKSVAAASPGETFQFVRSGFYTVDKGCTADKLVFNLTVELKGESKK
jgi:glutaminyl-tRNA synthetase